MENYLSEIKKINKTEIRRIESNYQSICTKIIKFQKTSII